LGQLWHGTLINGVSLAGQEFHMPAKKTGKDVAASYNRYKEFNGRQ
jgi:hypothetical protein